MEMRASLQASLPTLTHEKRWRSLARLPCSQGDVSIFEIWCTIIAMQVDVRLALNQLWDIGGQYGQESEEGEGNEEEDRQEEVVSPQKVRHPGLRHIKARALCDREADSGRGLMWFSKLEDRSRTKVARRRRMVRLFL